MKRLFLSILFALAALPAPMLAQSKCATGAQQCVVLTWQYTQSATDQAVGFQVYREVVGHGGYGNITSSETGSGATQMCQKAIAAATLTCEDDGVEGGVSYQYYVVAIDAAGLRSGPSNSISVTIPGPAKATNLSSS